MLAWEEAYAALGALIVGLAIAHQLGPRAAVYSVPLLALLISFATFALDPVVPLPDFPYLYIASAAAPFLLYVALVGGWEGSRWSSFGLRTGASSWRALLLLSLGLVAVYLIFTLEPGVVLGFRINSATKVGSFALYFLTTPLLVLGEESLFRGYLLTKFGERIRLPSAFLLSGVLFAAFTFNPLLIGTIPLVSLGQVVFTGPVVSLMVGVVASIYFYKADWSLLGPWTFRTGITWASLLLPVEIAAAWPTIFTFELIALGAVLAVVYAALREPRYQARHFLHEPLNPRRRTLIAQARARRETLETSVLVISLAVIVIIAGPPLLESSSAPVRLDAIATGSMVPTLDIGTLVVLEPIASPSDIHVGEIVAYDAPYLSTSGPVVHRVTAIHTVGGAPSSRSRGTTTPFRTRSRSASAKSSGKSWRASRGSATS